MNTQRTIRMSTQHYSTYNTNEHTTLLNGQYERAHNNAQRTIQTSTRHYLTYNTNEHTTQMNTRRTISLCDRVDVGLSGVAFDMDAYRLSNRADGCVTERR